MPVFKYKNSAMDRRILITWSDDMHEVYVFVAGINVAEDGALTALSEASRIAIPRLEQTLR